MTPVETYLTELRDIRSSGAAVKETSYYPALSSLLNEVGKKLKPRVRCIINIANRGAGIPDGGLFTPDQFQKPSNTEPLPGQLPSRGVIEVKPASDDAWVTANGEQVSRYWGKYRQVLVTNYRDFLLVGQDAEGKPVKLESFRLADSEKAFWNAAIHPRSLAEKIGPRFEEYLMRVMRHTAQLAAPEDVAWFLASYARDAKARIEGVELPALATVRAALEEALGLKFKGEKGEHFFRSSLVQTLFYGVFSAWVLWAKKTLPSSKKRFDWRLASWYLRVPMINKLFSLIADPGQLENLNLIEVLDWTGQVLNRVVHGSFFHKFQESHAVQYFYEPFLAAFDPKLRKELGVWYTPPEIAKYMVERVDTTLRHELGLADGLADKRVYILDPCCGTGSYLVEVLDRIHRTLKERNEDDLVAADLKEAAQNRVFGFEILPAPFVVSHLQLGLLLQNLGAPLSEKSKERVRVYLTNALTGWEPPSGPKKQLLFKEMEEERDAAEQVKRVAKILVILGNPPYDAFAGVSPAEEQGLVEPYKTGLISEWGIKKFNLDDLYVRFFRLAERRIVQGPPGRGVVCFISNFSYLNEPSYVVMRRRFLDEFGRIYVDCMNGDSRETGKRTPDGKPDPSVFSTKYNRAGIRKGTAIALLVREGDNQGSAPEVRFRHFWGVTKKRDLLESLNDPDLEARYQFAEPEQKNRYSFRPGNVSDHYKEWPRASDLCVQVFNGPVERRGNSLVVFQGQEERFAALKAYLDEKRDDNDIRALEPRFMISSGELKAEKARKLLKGKAKYDAKKIVRYPFKPFDVRLAYLDGAIQPLFSRPSPDLLSHRDIPQNSFFITRDTADKKPEGPPFYFSHLVCDYDCISGHARHFPIFVHPAKERKTHEAQTVMKLQAKAEKANLSSLARVYLTKLGISNPDADPSIAELIWVHALAIGYSPVYLSDNTDGIRQGWPRIPLPASKEILLASAALGRQIAALLDTEHDVTTIHEPSLRKIAAFTLPPGIHLDQETHLPLIAGWGHDDNGRTMPGKGKLILRDRTEKERHAASEAGKARGLDATQAFQSLGDHTCDIYLNEAACWSNVPVRVWEYTIGGYQVIKKWLSYREEKLLGRPLKVEEVREVQNIARRIAAILLLEPPLDSNYRNVKEHTFAWK